MIIYEIKLETEINHFVAEKRFKILIIQKK